MSTMAASHGHNEACCNIPPVVAKGYKPRGSYEDIGGYKTCAPGLCPSPPLPPPLALASL